MPAREMLINTVAGRECRISIVENGVLEELYIERASSASHVGNIYKGHVTNIEPSIQAAFVDFGLPKNGFLHISDLHPSYFSKGAKTRESVGAKQPRHQRPSIQSCLKRGQEVVVQITKEGIGTKGPTLTTYLSIPGRLLVMMPGMSRLGVSKKIEDEEARAKARHLLAQLKLPQDIGFIIRTAGIDRTKKDLQRDLNYLVRLWQAVQQRIKTSRAPAEIYQESDLVIRTIRDVYNTDVSRIVCDSEAVAFKVREFLNMAMPRTRNTIAGAVPGLRAGGRDREDLQQARLAAVRRLARRRPGRGDGCDRRQLRALSRAQRRGDDGPEDRRGGRQGDSKAAAAARPWRGGRD